MQGLYLQGETLESEMAVYAWTYSACMNLFKATDDGLEKETHADRHSKKESVSLDLKLSAARSSLLWTARTQLDRLGVLCGQLPPKAPFLQSFAKPKQANLDAQIAITPIDLFNCPTLHEMFSTQDIFDSLYISLCQKINAECELSGRPRLTLAVSCYMAALHLDRGRYSTAVALLRETPQYLDEEWFELADSSLGCLVAAYSHEEQWEPLVHLCLKALATRTLPDDQRHHFNSKLLEGLRHVPEEVSCSLVPHLKLASVARAKATGTFLLEMSLNCQLAEVVPEICHANSPGGEGRFDPGTAQKRRWPVGDVLCQQRPTYIGLEPHFFGV